MNTERVKNISIALLCIVTLFLGVMIFVEESQYSISAAQEASIISLLERGDIHFSAPYMANHRPARMLALEQYEYDLESLAARFFGEDAPFLVEIEGSDKTFSLGLDLEDKLMFYSHRNNWVLFTISEGLTNEAFASTGGAAAARQLAEWYIEEIIGMPPGMEFFRQVFNHNGDYIISFFSSYRGHILYNDHIRVTVADRGVTSIFYSRVLNHGFIGESRSVFSGDEALLALLNHLRHVQQIEDRIGIGNMYLAYFLTDEGGVNVGVPSYVFTISLVNELRFNYIFNAHTNQHIWHEILR